MTERFDAFLSYSHKVDQELAIMLQATLQRIARPWHRRHSLRVFCDQVDLEASPELWSSIEQNLLASCTLLYLASPESAKSPWVQKEVETWARNHGLRKLLIVVTGGEWRWDARQNRFDPEKTNCLSPSYLLEEPDEEPYIVDLRRFRVQTDSGRESSEFLDTVMPLAAAIRDVPLRVLKAAHDSAERRKRQILQATVAVLLTLVVATTVTAIFAWAQFRRAETESSRARTTLANSYREAGRSTLLAGGDPRRALVYLAEACRLGSDSHTTRMLFARAEEAAARLDLELPFDGGTKALAVWSVDGNTLFLACGEKAPLLRESGVSWLPVLDQVVAASFDSEGRRIVTAGGGLHVGSALQVWDVETAKLVHSLQPGGILIDAVAIRADDAVLASADIGGVLRLQDLDSGVVISEVQTDGEPRSLEFTADGSVVMAGRYPFVRVWRDGEVVHTFEHDEGPCQAALPDDGRRIVTAGGSRAKVWDLATGNLLASLEHESSMNALELRPGGDFLLTAERLGVVHFWSLEGNHLARFDLEPSEGLLAARGVAWRSDGSTFAAGTSEGRIELWDAFRNVRLARLNGGERPIGSLAFSPDGGRLVSADDREVIRIWDTENVGPMTRVGNPFVDSVVGVSAGGGRVLVARPEGGGTSLRVVESATGIMLAETTTQNRVLKGRFAAGAESVLLVPSGEVWDLGAQRAPGKWDRAPTDLLDAVVGPRGTRAVVQASSGDLVQLDFGDRTTRLIESAVVAEGGTLGSRAEVRFAADSERAVVIRGSTADVWDLERSHRLLAAMAETGIPVGCALSPEGTRLIMWDAGGPVRVLDTTTGRELWRLDSPTESVNSAAISKRGAIVALARGSFVELRNGFTGAIVHSLSGPSAYVFHLEFSEDGRRVVGARGKNNLSGEVLVHTWSTETGLSLGVIDVHQEGAVFATFSPSGDRLLTSAANGVALTDLERGATIRLSRGPAFGAWSAAFDPSGERAVLIGDGDLWVWNLDGSEDAKRHPAGSPVVSARFHPAGDRLITSHGDSVCRIWHWPALTVDLEFEVEGLEPTDAVVDRTGETVAIPCLDGSVAIHDLHSGVLLTTIEAHDSPALQAAFLGDDRLVTIGSKESAAVWGLTHGEELFRFRGAPGKVEEAWLSPRGDYLLLATRFAATLGLWNVAEGERVALGERNPLAWPCAASFTRDGSEVAARTGLGLVSVFDTRSGRRIGSAENGPGSVDQILRLPSEDGLVICGSEGNLIVVSVHDAHGGPAVQRLTLATGWMPEFALHPTERLLALAACRSPECEGAFLQLWDLETETKLLEEPLSRWELKPVEFSPDGSTLLVGSGDQMPRSSVVVLSSRASDLTVERIVKRAKELTSWSLSEGRLVPRPQERDEEGADED